MTELGITLNELFDELDKTIPPPRNHLSDMMPMEECVDIAVNDFMQFLATEESKLRRFSYKFINPRYMYHFMTEKVRMPRHDNAKMVYAQRAVLFNGHIHPITKQHIPMKCQNALQVINAKLSTRDVAVIDISHLHHYDVSKSSDCKKLEDCNIERRAMWGKWWKPINGGNGNPNGYQYVLLDYDTCPTHTLNYGRHPGADCIDRSKTRA